MSHKESYLKPNIPSVDDAIRLLRSNGPVPTTVERYSGNEVIYKIVPYIWFVVKNKKSQLIEIGGRVDLDGLLEVKVYVPQYNKAGFPLFHTNNFASTDYSVEFDESENRASYNHSLTIQSIKNLKQFITFIANRKWSSNKIVICERLARTEDIYESYIEKI